MDMSVNPIIARRTVLAAGLAGAGAAALAACGSGGTSSSSEQANSGKPGQKVASLGGITVGDSASANINGKPVLVCRTGQNSAVCFSAICTHQGCTVNPDGSKLVCPCHQSTYDAKTGKVLQGPAPSPLPQIRVTVANGEIVTA
jgi:Rieske Fe-S protein